MKLNDTVDLVSYFFEADRACFELACSFPDAAAIDGAKLTVTDNDVTIEELFGYEVSSISATGDCLRVWFDRKLDDATKATIEKLEASVSELRAQVGDVQQDFDANRSIKMAATMYVNSESTMTDSQAASVIDLIDDFEAGAAYRKGQIRRFDGRYWRIAQDLTGETTAIYQPGTGTESLYTLIDLAADGVRIWHAPTDATNCFMKDEKCHYPDGQGPIYVSLIDGNTTCPDDTRFWTEALHE